MQCSPLKISSPVCTSGGACGSSSRKSAGISSLTVTLVAVSCLVCIVGLLVGAFATGSDADDGNDLRSLSCNDSVVSESTMTVLIFALGYLSSLAAKRRHEIAVQVDRMICWTVAAGSSAVGRMASSIANVRESRRRLQNHAWCNKGVIAIATAGTLCATCIIGLLVSAFTVEPDADPADGGLASESSTGMRVFTVGWMFLLSFKLRRELVGQVGSCCLLQPW